MVLEILPKSEAEQFLAIARIVKTQGRRGEVAAEILTDFPERFHKLRSVFLERTGHPPINAALENIWFHKGRVVLKFKGIDSIDQAHALVGSHVLILRAEKIPLPPDQYYVWELRGCRVVRESGATQTEVGTVIDVQPTGGVDLLRVLRRGGPRKEVLIPLAQEICLRIDLEMKTILINPPDELLEVND